MGRNNADFNTGSGFMPGHELNIDDESWENDDYFFENEHF